MCGPIIYPRESLVGLNKCMFCGLVLAFCQTVWADGGHTVTKTKQSKYNVSEVDLVARDNGLTEADFSKYKKIMENTSAGVWYGTLDPVEVLGIMAESDAEREKFAQLAARQHFERADRELKFNQAYHLAFKKLYPSEKAIADVADEKGVATDIQHVLLFTGMHEAGNEAVINKLLAVLRQNPECKLDIYIAGKPTGAQVNSWAVKHKIPVELVRKRQITLNHENGKLRRVVPNLESVAYPLALLKQAGEYRALGDG